jgi:thiamine-phosphate pyrophosphorylase
MTTLGEARAKLARHAARLNARNGRGGPALVLMTDDARATDWQSAVGALPRGSAIVVRHRDARAREAMARALHGLCAARGVRLLIADDARLAVRLRADGLHVPEKQIGRLAGLRALYPRWLVSASAHGARAVGAAVRAGADAVLIAPVFATASHPGRQALGALRAAMLASEARIPVYALGGIDAASALRVSAARLSGVALIGGWTGA